MQNALKSTGSKKVSGNKRKFKVGIVGASEAAFTRISRIFQNTEFRTRYYEAVHIEPNRLGARHSVDFIIMCSLNPNVVNAWKKTVVADASVKKSMIFLAMPNVYSQEKYLLTAPINPTKLIKLLDHYTIKELNFFPEFQIGNENAEMHDLAASGLKLLRASPNENATNYLGRKIKALVVDDSLAVRRQMQLEFELQYADLDVANTAEAAMQAIVEQQYDIIFLDVVMPGMDGYAACKRIKRSVLNKNTPVIMLTSRSGSFDKIKGTLAGCDSYLVKPLNHNEFETVYHRYVGKMKTSVQTGERLHAS